MTPSLPMEIMQLIFHDLRPDTNDKIATALTLSAISQHWRSVALSTPSLWSTFSVCLRAHYTVDLLPVLFKRSLPDLLDITVAVDFRKEDTSEMLKVHSAIALLRSEADRIERLHLRFLGHMDGRRDILAQFVEFHSCSLKYIEMEALLDDDAHALLMEDFCSLVDPTQRGSDHCPALTHVTCTDPRMLVYHPSLVTYICIKGVPDRGNNIDFDDLRNVLFGTQALAELVIDGVSLQHVHQAISLPHLHSLSLRSSTQLDVKTSFRDAGQLAFFMQLLNTPVLASLTIPETADAIRLWLRAFPNITIPSVTRFAVALGTSQSLFEYPLFLPGVKELVLLGADAELDGIASFRVNPSHWPDLSMINLTELESPSPRGSVPSPTDSASTGVIDSDQAIARG